MEIKVKFFASFRDKAGVPVARFCAGDVGELFKDVLCEYEGLEGEILDESESRFPLKKGVTVMVNGRNIRFLDGFSTKLNDGDSVAIFPPVGGG
ncbi:MAG: ubiquitin-like small modifier protein 1 [Candidatus Bipolaricaulota bacterium]